MNGIQGDLKAVLKGLKDLTKKAEAIGKKIEKMEKASEKKAAVKPKAAKKVGVKSKRVKKEAKRLVTRKPPEKKAGKAAVKVKPAKKAAGKAVKKRKPAPQSMSQPIEATPMDSVVETVSQVTDSGSEPVETAAVMEQTGSANQEVTEKRTKLRKKEREGDITSFISVTEINPVLPCDPRTRSEGHGRVERPIIKRRL